MQAVGEVVQLGRELRGAMAELVGDDGRELQFVGMVAFRAAALDERRFEGEPTQRLDLDQIALATGAVRQLPVDARVSSHTSRFPWAPDHSALERFRTV